MTTDEIMALVGEYAESNRRWEGPDSFTYVKLRSTIEALQADVARYREALLMARRTLTDRRIGTWRYMEGSEIYDDFSAAVAAIDAAMALDKP